MRVTNRWLIPFLDKLADFLNHDFDAQVWKGTGALIEGVHEFQGAEGIRKAKAVQVELRELLNPVIRNNVNFYEGLGVLLGCLANIQSETTLLVRPANRKATRLAQEDLERVKKLAEDGSVELNLINKSPYRPVSSAQNFLSIHGSKWAIETRPKVAEGRSYLLWIVAAAVKEGELSRLRICRYCHRYFVAKYSSAKRQSCTDRCRVDFWNNDHVESGYLRRLRRRKKSRKLAVRVRRAEPD